MVDKYDNYELRKVTSLENVRGTIKDGDGYIWDPSELPDKDFDDSKVPLNYRRLAIWMRSKLFGKDVRETIARLAEMFGLNFKELMASFGSLENRQGNLETKTANDVARMEADKNAVIANVTVDSEVILARGDKITLGQRLDETDAKLAQAAAKTDGTVSIAEFGAVGDFDFDTNTGTDNSQAVLDALNMLTSEGTLIIPQGFFYVTQHIPIHCNVEAQGTFVVPNHINRTFFTFPKEEEIRLTGSEIFNSLVKGKLSTTVASSGNTPALESLVDYYFSLESNEKLIDRLGSGRYSPYTKNETGEFVKVGNDNNIKFKTRLLHTYKNMSDLSVILSKKMKKKVINNLKIIRANTGTSEHNQKVFTIRGNNLELNNFFFDNYSGSFGACLHLENASNIFLNHPVIKNVDGSTGDTYSIINSNSAYIYINDYWYGANYPTISKGYAARHGNYVYFNNCEMNGIDDHFGHNYFATNCKFLESGITFAGGNFTIKDSDFYNCFSAFTLRRDTPYGEGRLLFDNVDFYGCIRLIELPINNGDPLGRTHTTGLKFFDEIIMRNCGRYDTFKYNDRTYGETDLIKTYSQTNHYHDYVKIGSILIEDCNFEDVAVITLPNSIRFDIDSIIFRNIKIEKGALNGFTSQIRGGFVYIEGEHKIGEMEFLDCKNGGVYVDHYSFGSPKIKETRYINCVFNDPMLIHMGSTTSQLSYTTYEGCTFDGITGYRAIGSILILINNRFMNIRGYTLTNHGQTHGGLGYSMGNILDAGTGAEQVPTLTGYINPTYFKQTRP